MADLFEEKSKTWDSNDRRRLLSAGIAESILKNVILKPEMQVLDFGAGTGLISSQIAPFVKKITAVDVSQSMLEKLRSKPDLQDKVEVLCQDITEKPIGIQYDLIVSAMAMHHVHPSSTSSAVLTLSHPIKSSTWRRFFEILVVARLVVLLRIYSL